MKHGKISNSLKYYLIMRQSSFRLCRIVPWALVPAEGEEQMPRPKLNRETPRDPYLEGIVKREPSSLEAFSDIINRMGNEQLKRAQISREAFAMLNKEFPLRPEAEALCDLVLRHHIAVARLSAVSVAPRDKGELKEWMNELCEVREKLNKIVAMMLAEGEE
jgi:hypothetical protein